MILVLTGLGYLPFDRLILEMDQIARDIEETVIIQKGPSTVAVNNAESFQWKKQDEMDLLIKAARIVVAHAGVGTLIDCARHGKRIIVVPRTRNYGEAVDDHQSEIGDKLATEGKVVLIRDVRLLKDEIQTINDSSIAAPLHSNRAGLVSALERILEQTGGQSG